MPSNLYAESELGLSQRVYGQSVCKNYTQGTSDSLTREQVHHVYNYYTHSTNSL